MPPGKPTSFRLSARALEILADFKERYGLQTTAVVELALRKLDESEDRSRRGKNPKKPREGG